MAATTTRSHAPNGAYLNYRPVEGLSIKAGRIAVPCYMFSQNINVGHGYTWARLPELYSSIPFQDITGLDLTYTLPLGDWSLELVRRR